MTAPDTTAAFTAEAEQIDKDAEIARLKAELAGRPTVLDEDGNPVTGDGQQLDVTEELSTLECHGATWRYRVPTEGQMMMFALASARRTSGQRRLNGIYNFLDACLAEESYDQLEEMIADPDTQFGAEEMMDLIGHIVEAANASPRHQAPKTGPAGK